MEEAHSVEVMEVLVCASGVVYGLVLAYGIKQEWRWIFDPPEWTSVIYFPTVVTAYGALVMSLICLVQSLVASLS
jgi:predicted nucleic acid-binding protein